MHITVSFKDHSSICTCMLIKKEKKINKKKKTQQKKKILNDWAETRTSPHTNSLPMKGGFEGEGSDKKTAFTSDLNVSRVLKKEKSWGCPRLSFTQNTSVPRRPLHLKGYIFPTKPTRMHEPNVSAPGDLCPRLRRCCSPWGVC